ncbi:MAG: hypothetical protein M3290_07805 [Actinomycetota bacterium]|nr:hypothetical protein [Actinomycetota bacterium]
MDRAELDKLSSSELHDRAVEHAKHHLDIAFLWRLIKSIPAAEAAAGDIGEAEVDVISAAQVLNDAVHAGEGDLADALRPLYIDYLAEHSDA